MPGEYVTAGISIFMDKFRNLRTLLWGGGEAEGRRFLRSNLVVRAGKHPNQRDRQPALTIGDLQG